jgi:hypothetical protein
MFGVAKVPTRNGPVYIYTGERYQTAPDDVFGHGFMYWQPLRFNADGVPAVLNWTSSFELPL